MRIGRLAVTVLGSVALLLTAGNALADSNLNRGLVKIDGSSTVYPITEAVAEEFQNSTQGKIKVTVGISGTGGGFKKFARGETDISNASRPILEAEIQEAKKNGITFIELPVAFDALTVMVNPKNTWVDHLTVDELRTIWAPEAQGKITNWNQVRAGFPDAPLKLYGAGSDSGTFDYFTEAIVGKAKSSRGDFTASEDDNVLVQGISSDKNALGYFGFAYYVENMDKLKAVPVVNPRTGTAVLPSQATVRDGSYAPLSRPIFIYASLSSMARPEVVSFLEFFINNAQSLVEEVKYVPLPAGSYSKAIERVTNRVAGTVFAGHAEVGMDIEALFNRTPVS